MQKKQAQAGSTPKIPTDPQSVQIFIDLQSFHLDGELTNKHHQAPTVRRASRLSLGVDGHRAWWQWLDNNGRKIALAPVVEAESRCLAFIPSYVQGYPIASPCHSESPKFDLQCWCHSHFLAILTHHCTRHSHGMTLKRQVSGTSTSTTTTTIPSIMTMTIISIHQHHSPHNHDISWPLFTFSLKIEVYMYSAFHSGDIYV